MTAVRSVSDNGNSQTFYGQRPIVEPSQFLAHENVVATTQNPDGGNLLGLSLPAWREPQSRSHRDLCEQASDLILGALGTAMTNKGFPAGQIVAAQGELKKNIAGTVAVHDLVVRAQSLLPIASIDASQGIIQNPRVEFQQRFLAGTIHAPTLNFNEVGNPQDGAVLQAMVEIAYLQSGIPRLSQALSLQDVIATDAVTQGEYAPSAQFQESGRNYHSRSSISVVSRIAWNQVSGQSLYGRSSYIPANMYCVTDVVAGRAYVAAGMCPVIVFTKAQSPDRLAAADEFGGRAFITVRSGDPELAMAREIMRRGGNVALEMANAFDPRVCEFVRTLKREFPAQFVMVGNVGSPQGYWFCVEAGADVVKLGRGPGAGCTTPRETGISPGQVSLAYEVALVAQYLLLFRGKDVPFCLDGGLVTPGHAAMAARLGAETTMWGSKFGGVNESPGARFVDGNTNIFVEYFGMASPRAAQIDGRAVPQGQGITGFIPAAGPVSEVVAKLDEGLRGAVADSGVRTLQELAGGHRADVMKVVGHGVGAETGTRLNHAQGYIKIRDGRMEGKGR